ncbi:MAG: 60S ribosomal protein L31 [Candidatus Micrarchaeota archaeon]|nr:60S ribosomal protein L31 [Candidatus Micrarchaeota archaeon]
MATLERIYNIPLGDAYLRVRTKRAKRAIAFIKDFAIRHMKAVDVRISEGTNLLVFRDGMQKPPRKIKVRIVKGEDGVAWVWLPGEEEKKKAEEEKKKKEQEAKKAEEEKKAKEAEKSSAPQQQEQKAPEQKQAGQ